MDGSEIPCLASVFILNVPFWGISFVENKLFRFASVFAKYEFKLKKNAVFSYMDYVLWRTQKNIGRIPFCEICVWESAGGDTAVNINACRCFVDLICH